MARLKSLLAKAEQLLAGQWDSLLALDAWFHREPSVPAGVREEWERAFQLEEFFRREHFAKISGEVAAWEQARDETRGLRVAAQCLGSLENDPTPAAFWNHVAQELDCDRAVVLSCSEESSQARVLASAAPRAGAP